MDEWGMIRLGASVEENANATYEELMGSADPDAPGYKPMRSDIQKLHDIWQMYVKVPDNKEAMQQWIDMIPAGRDDKLIALFQHVFNNRGAPTYHDHQKSFDYVARATTNRDKVEEETGDELIDGLNTLADAFKPESTLPPASPEAKKELGTALKKYENSYAPLLYVSIVKALDNCRNRSPESYKLWPWMVKQMKEDFQHRMFDGSLPPYSRLTEGRLLPGLAHLVDIVTEAGPILAKLRAENKLPQNFDFQKLNFREFEEWLMEWKRENQVAENQGQVVYEYDNGWTMQRLWTPEQLQYEGDEMGHCVGGYSHEVSRGDSIIYSLRDKKGEPHVTIEVEGLSALKPYGDKPVADYRGDEADSLHENMQGESDYGRYYPAPINGYMHNPENYDENQNQVATTGRTQMYPFETVKLSPDDDPKGLWQRANTLTDNVHHVKPLEHAFQVVQVQGQSNLTPKPEYKKMVREFLDYLRSKGWKFERSDNWYANHDDPYGDYDDYEYPERIHEARDLDDWWDDHYRTNYSLYRIPEGEVDDYGFEKAKQRMRPGISDWDDLLISICSSLVDEYDPGRFTHRWDLAARQVYHAYVADMYYDEPTPEQKKKATEGLEHALQEAEEKLQEWEWNNEMYATDDRYLREQITDDAIERLEKTGEWPKLLEQIKQKDENYDPEEDEWYEPDKDEVYELLQEEQPDLLSEITWDTVNEHYSGDAHKFLGYLYMLINKHGLADPADLPDPNDSNSGLPTYDDLSMMPWKQEEMNIPGTLSSVKKADATPYGMWFWWQGRKVQIVPQSEHCEMCRGTGISKNELMPGTTDQLYSDTCRFCNGDGKNHGLIAGNRDPDSLFWLQYEGARAPFGWLPKDELVHYIETDRLKPVVPDHFAKLAIVDIGKCQCGGGIGADGYCMVCGRYNDEYWRPQRVPRFQQGMPQQPTQPELALSASVDEEWGEHD